MRIKALTLFTIISFFLKAQTVGYLPKYLTTTTFNNSTLFQSGTNLGISNTSPTEKLDVLGNIRLNNYDFLIRGGSDVNHGLGWYGSGKLFGGFAPDGPVLYGFLGGMLGSSAGGAKSVLRWNQNNQVLIGSALYFGAQLDIVKAANQTKLFRVATTAYDVFAPSTVGELFSIEQNGKTTIRPSTGNPIALNLVSSGTVGWANELDFSDNTGNSRHRIIDNFTDNSLEIYAGWGMSRRVVNINGKLKVGYYDKEPSLTAYPNWQMAVDGDLIAKRVVVNISNWPDYVFEINYRKKSLEELAAFVEENKHLPDVPSASEIEQQGLSLGDMDKILLKKIEELTLYVIELKKENTDIRMQLSNVNNGK